MFAEQLFKEIETKKAGGGIEFEVKLSMLEIYNEVTTQEYVVVVAVIQFLLCFFIVGFVFYIFVSIKGNFVNLDSSFY